MTERPEDIHRPAAAETARSAPAATPSAESGAEDIVWEGDAAALDTPALTRLLTRRAAAPEDAAMPAADGDAEDDAEDGDETEDAEDDDAAGTASGDAPTADAPWEDAPSEDAPSGRPQRSRRPRHEQGDPGWVRLEPGEAEDDGADGDDAAEDDPDDAPAAPADAPEPTAAAPEAADGTAPTARPLSRHPQLRTGRGAILAALKTMPDSPGVYRMLDGHGDVLYVGKAKHLKRRVASYTRINQLQPRLMRMVAETRTMEIVTTASEAEALLLEANLIKRLRPRFNVLLRDDKSFPYILITGDHDFPQILKHRGARNRKGEYFGPFASAGAVNETLAVLEKAFLLRNCSDSVFESRSRPCLQYQIKRCSAPCCAYVDRESYGRLVAEARDFLRGRSASVRQAMQDRMAEAANDLDFETAAVYRDRIKALARVTATQGINFQGLEDVDVVAIAEEGGQSCIQVFFFRGGQNYGNRAYFPANEAGSTAAEVLSAFLGQFYADKLPPREVVLDREPDEADLVAQALSVRAGHKVRLTVPRRGDKLQAVTHAATNAREALGRKLAETSSQKRLLEGTRTVFGLERAPQRIEVYDNAHISGTHAVCGMIVAGPEGFDRRSYRSFTIRDIDPAKAGGDDYAMMREVMRRRFGRLARELDEAGGETDRVAGWPDLVLLDGGEGQLQTGTEELEAAGLTGRIMVAAIAKGPDRDAGRERFFLPGRAPFRLPERDPVLYFLQRLRDEAHRFAGGQHRAKRSRAIGTSALDEIPGIGPKRKKALLHHFGSAKAVEAASLTDIARVEGISTAVARQIYGFFHPEG
ncbi:excinuclease ABC subunit UvrC [Tistrella mobilis]|uniref:excinuclease ABC subunit UvrC n=1 Tax=Tistrella mobilis TaxID=171437 RepID=UPI003559335E